MGIGYNPKIVTDGLVLCLDAANRKSYPGSGNTWTDLSGLGNNGTLTNGPTFSNNSIVFDGVDDFVPCGNSSSLSFTNSFSLSIWCSSNNLSGYRSPIMKTTSSNWADGYGIFQYQNVMYFYVNLWNGAQTVSVPRSVYAITNWIGTYDGTKLRLYENGLLVSEGSSFTSNVNNSNNNLEIGRGGGSAFNWSGSISNFTVHNRALSAIEIQQNFQALRGRYGI